MVLRGRWRVPFRVRCAEAFSLTRLAERRLTGVGGNQFFSQRVASLASGRDSGGRRHSQSANDIRSGSVVQKLDRLHGSPSDA